MATQRPTTGSRHLATGLGGIALTEMGTGRRPHLPCAICGRMRPVSTTTKGKPVSYCSDCRIQERELIKMWEARDATDRQPEG